MNVQKLYIDQIPKYIQKKVQTVQTLYKVQTKNSLKLEIYAFCIQRMQIYLQIYFALKFISV